MFVVILVLLFSFGVYKMVTGSQEMALDCDVSSRTAIDLLIIVVAMVFLIIGHFV